MINFRIVELRFIEIHGGHYSNFTRFVALNSPNHPRDGLGKILHAFFKKLSEIVVDSRRFLSW